MQKEKGKREVNKPRIRETKHFSKNKKVKEQKVSEQTKDRSTSKNTEPTEQLTTDLTKEEMLRILREEYDSFRRKSLESQSNMPEYDLTDSEIKVLVLLDMVTSSIKRENLFVPSEIPVKIVDRHLIGDFLEMISSDLQISEDVDKILNQLEELELITEKKIANCLLSVEITVDGKKIAEKYKDKYFEEILVALAKYVEEVVDSDELAKRILQILDIVGLSTKRKLENYFTNISTQFEDAILLIIFLLFDDKFRKHHTISKITRKIRKDVPDNKMLEDFCKDDDFLKALAILYMDKIWDRLGIDFVMEDSNPKIIGSIYSYRTIIHKLIDEKCTEILSKLILLGVLGSDKYNIFKLNVIEVLSNNLDRIKSFFKFDASKAKEIISEMDVEMIEDFQFNLEETIELIKCGALIPYDGGLYIRKEFEEMIRERSQEHAAKIAEDTKVEKQPEPTPDITPTKDVEIPEDFEPFKLLFDFEGKTIDFDNPLVICLEETPHDSHIGSVRTICKLIYREKVGGLPDPTIIETIDKPEDLFEQIRAEGRIVSIKLNEKEWGMLTKKDWQKLWSRIKELFAQGFGVVIFNRSLTQLSEHIVNYINLKPRVLPVELKKEILELFWG
ncbi:hypothetical protein DRP05_01330 [Archaeoglobales archaeon]|nr:MAG: hypothetical protein DRP05_01330 [Archaeoglobales archaeon]